MLVRLSAVFLLEEEGYDTVQASNADEAIDLLETEGTSRSSSLTSNMPGSMDGFALAHAIRIRWPPVWLVLTSGYARFHNSVLPARGQFLAKPYEPAELLRMVRSVAGLRP
jgi:CheY-like chemotaxis protein